MAMTPLRETPTNRSKMAQLERTLSETFAEVLRRGFFGTASIELAIQDGTIQYIRSKLERIEK
jgi:hypothetical protein